VNNAGIMHTAPIEATTEEMWDAQIDLNLKGTFFMTQAVLPEFRRLGRGKVINISSIWVSVRPKLSAIARQRAAS